MMNKYPSLILLQKISLESDKVALNELLSRRKLFIYGSERLMLTEFLWNLKEKYQVSWGSKKTSSELIDCAYDLTLAKFTNIPGVKTTSTLESSDKTSGLKHAKVNCRKYYKAILKLLVAWEKKNPQAGIIDKEMVLANIFQRMIVKQFRFSIADCRRIINPFSHRYFWKFGDKQITLRCPTQISGRYFRQWLEKHITDPNPSRPGEKERIQDEVDGYFNRHPEITLDDRWATYELATGGHLLADGKEYAWMPKKVDELMLTVAEEKTQNIDQMRPAIRDLGKNSLYQMIITIFDALYREKFEDNRIAKEFGLSKATFSRFAGSKWFTKLEGGAAHIPDLWMNTAKILATSPDFIELATAAGILPKLKKAMGIIGGSYD
jgi:hypothetical protein